MSTILTPQLALALVAVFGAVATATGLVSWQLLLHRDPVRRRLRDMTQPEIVRVSAAAPLLLDQLTPAMQRLSQWVPNSLGQRQRLRARLTAVGYHGASAVVLFSALQVALATVSGMLFMAVAGAASWRAAAVFAIAAFFAPQIVLRRAFKARQREIQNGLPDALDLTVICLEAGCSLDHAIAKTSDELALAYPALAAELNFVRAETRAGKSKIEAFKNFAERTEVDDVRSLVAMLGQTERFGTSVTQALRVHASTARNRRRQRAEERAAKASVKLVFPLVFLLFPAFFVVTLGPAILQFARALSVDVLPNLE